MGGEGDGKCSAHLGCYAACTAVHPPARGTPGRGEPGRHAPTTWLDGTTRGSMRAGTLKAEHSSASQASVWMLKSSVRDAFETSTGGRARYRPARTAPTPPPPTCDVLPGELPGQEGIHRPREGVARLCGLPQSGDVFEEPRQLRCTKIRHDGQPRLVPETVCAAILVCDVVAHGSAPLVLPHERIVKRTPRLAIPHNDCFALVGDADSGNVRRRELGVAQSSGNARLNGSPYVQGVMLNPRRSREDLRMFSLRRRDR